MIAARSVTVGYGRSPVLRSVSLAPRSGEVLGLLGPNGAGKSTLLRVLTRLLPPAAGRVDLDGGDLYAAHDARSAARRIALVPQEEGLAFPLSVRELVALGRTPYLGRFGWLDRRDRAAVEAALRAMDLGPLADRPVATLSGGERKRAPIARALAQEASVLLLDEPTAHLDVAHALDLVRHLRRLAAGGRTVILASHELWLLARGCDRLALLHGGRIAAAGTPGVVLRSAAAARAFGARLRLIRTSGVLSPVVLPARRAR